MTASEERPTARETSATIERVRRISPALQHLELGVSGSLARIRPGQAVLARLSDAWDPYLPEPWPQAALNGSTITVERPVGDQYAPGQAVTLLGPVGAPILLRPYLRSLLLLALDAPPTPLVLLAKLAVRGRVEVTLVRSGQATAYPLDALPKEVEVLEGDLERGWPNQVMTVGWADQVIAVANPAYRDTLYSALLARLRELRAEIPNRYALGIYDLPMPCGVGACQGCRVQCQGGDKLTCLDGPALDLTRVLF